MVPKCFNGMAEFADFWIFDIKGALSKMWDSLLLSLSLD
jgi:hypothetical protein